MGKKDLKRAASKHSQNLADMFKRKKLSTSDMSTISTTSENLAITNPVTSDVLRQWQLLSVQFYPKSRMLRI